jgi:ATP-dependent DNA helicase
MTDGKMSSMDNPLSRKVDSLVSQMDQFSKQIEQYLGESCVGRDDDDESQDGDSDVCNFKMGLQELLQTSKFAMLRDYQQYGIKWLLSLHTSGLNGIIADEMGLGKTLQVIKFLAALKNQTGKVGPHLMIGPLSVLSNWYHEIEKYAPNEFDVYVHYGSKKEREQSFREVCDDWRRLHRKAVKKSTKISIILTTFNMAINDDSLFRNFTKLCGKSFAYLIVDEAHRIKNQACVLYQQLKLFPVEYRLLLTGTPLQNNLQELWSLLKFLVPKIFPKHEDIQEWFSSYFQVEIDVASNTHNGPSSSATSATTTAVRKGTTTTTTTTTTTPTRGRGHKLFATKLVLPSTSSGTGNTRQDHTQLLKSADRDKIIHSLHRVLKPFILRRIKADVAIDIPYKVDTAWQWPCRGGAVC